MDGLTYLGVSSTAPFHILQGPFRGESFALHGYDCAFFQGPQGLLQEALARVACSPSLESAWLLGSDVFFDHLLVPRLHFWMQTHLKCLVSPNRCPFLNRSKIEAQKCMPRCMKQLLRISKKGLVVLVSYDIGIGRTNSHANVCCHLYLSLMSRSQRKSYRQRQLLISRQRRLDRWYASFRKKPEAPSGALRQCHTA